jgi:hypothetical protein
LRMALAADYITKGEWYDIMFLSLIKIETLRRHPSQMARTFEDMLTAQFHLKKKHPGMYDVCVCVCVCL